MSELYKLFFELLLVCMGAKDKLSRVPKPNQWVRMLTMAEEQTLVGVCFSAIERLPREQRPDVDTMMQWWGEVQMLEDNSIKMADASEAVIKYFRENGFACNILKGSAVARYYPQPERRSSGDVDVWVVPVGMSNVKCKVSDPRKVIYEFARKNDPNGRLHGVNYHHIHFHLIEDVHIEVHIWPSFLSSPLRNWRLHKFCNLHRPTMETDMPSLSFDRVFILLHGYQHICGHGVGLRQIMDYYYVLKQGFTEDEKADSVYWIKQLGMRRFAHGLMWVLQKYFGLEEQYLLMEPDEKEGRFIIHEVMQTGNMGHSDTRNWGSMKSPLSRFFLNLRRDIYLAKHYPHEALWQPFFSIWLYFWRWSKGLLKLTED